MNLYDIYLKFKSIFLFFLKNCIRTAKTRLFSTTPTTLAETPRAKKLVGMVIFIEF